MKKFEAFIALESEDLAEQTEVDLAMMPSPWLRRSLISKRRSLFVGKASVAVRSNVVFVSTKSLVQG